MLVGMEILGKAFRQLVVYMPSSQLKIIGAQTFDSLHMSVSLAREWGKRKWVFKCFQTIPTLQSFLFWRRTSSISLGDAFLGPCYKVFRLKQGKCFDALVFQRWVGLRRLVVQSMVKRPMRFLVGWVGTRGQMGFGKEENTHHCYQRRSISIIKEHIKPSSEIPTLQKRTHTKSFHEFD